MRQTGTVINSIIIKFLKPIVIVTVGWLATITIWAITRIETVDVLQEKQSKIEVKLRDYSSIREKVINCEKFHDNLGPVMINIEKSVAATREDVATIKGRLMERSK